MAKAMGDGSLGLPSKTLFVVLRVLLGVTVPTTIHSCTSLYGTPDLR